MIRWLFDNNIRTDRDLVGYVARLTVFCVVVAFVIDASIQLVFFVSSPAMVRSICETLAITTVVAGLTLATIGRTSRALCLLKAEMEHQSRTDVLTGLANRRAFMTRLEDRAGEPGSLVLLDLDYFKAVNDRFGHAAGDAVLADFARRLAAAFEPTGFAARIGGEEFAVLAAEPHRDAVARAETFRATLTKTPMPFEGEDIVVTASIGVASGQGRTPRDLYATADRALYLAKTRGRNRVCDGEVPVVETAGDLLWIEAPVETARTAA